MSAGRAARERGALALVLLCTALVHARALGAVFGTDDFLHLYDVRALPLADALVKRNGGHFMALHKLLFLALHALAGLNPLPWSALALGTHLANAALLFGLCRRLGARVALAGLAALLYGASPVHQETLRWFSAYGALLGTSFALLALRALAPAAREGRSLRAGELARAALALALAAATVGSGAVVALAFPLVAWLALPRAPGRVAALASFAAVAALAAGLARGAADGTVPVDLGDALRLFLALASYAAGAAFGGPALAVADGSLALFPGLEAAHAVAAGAALAALALPGFARALRGAGAPQRGFAAGALLLAAALFAAVAWSRSFLAAGSGLAGIATQSRYHTLPCALLLVGAASALAPHAAGLRLPRASAAAAALALLVFVAASLRAAQGAAVPGAQGAPEFSAEVGAAIRKLALEQPAGATLHLRNTAFLPVALNHALGIPRSEFPNLGAYWLIAHGTQPFAGRRLRFVEPDPRTLAGLRARVRPEVAALFVSTEELRRAGARAVALPGLAEISARWRRAQPWLPAPD